MVVRLERFIDLEVALEKFLTQRWDAAVTAAWPAIQADIEDDNQQAALAKIGAIRSGPLSREAAARLRALLLMMQNFGSELIQSDTRTYWSSQKVNEPLGWATRQIAVFEDKTIAPLAAGTALRLMQRQDQEAVEQAEAGYAVAVFKAAKAKEKTAQNAARSGGRQGAAIAANLTTSRLVNYSALHRMRARRVTTYALRVTLDQRTSAICRGLVGKTFQVEDGLSVLRTALLVEDPNDLKAVHPWIPNTSEITAQLQAMPAPTMQGNGWLVPPFHARCRTIVEEADSSITVDVDTISQTPVAPLPAIIGPPKPTAAQAAAASLLSAVRDATSTGKTYVQQVRDAFERWAFKRKITKKRKYRNKDPVDKA